MKVKWWFLIDSVNHVSIGIYVMCTHVSLLNNTTEYFPSNTHIYLGTVYATYTAIRSYLVYKHACIYIDYTRKFLNQSVQVHNDTTRLLLLYYVLVH